MRSSERLAALGGYAFDELDRLRDARRAAGVDVIDFGVGDPTEPTPDVVVDAARAGLERHRRAGYPPYRGGAPYREAVAQWFERRHGVRLDAETQVASTIGSKEAVFHLPGAFLDPGDVVLVPSPGYPPYTAGARFVGARAVPYPVWPRGAGGCLPDLDTLPDDLAACLRMVWITQPHVPTGRIAERDELQRLLDQCRERDVLLCSDEAYGELGFDQRPASPLELGSDNVLVVQSLSKRAAMTGYRVGFVAGDARAVKIFLALKTQIDSGTPWFIQDAAMAALADEDAPASARAGFAERAELLVPALRRAGCKVEHPEAGFYLWGEVPGGKGVDFARRLLEESPALAVLPGEWLTEPVAGLDRQPGDGRIRLALVPSLERCREAADRLEAWA